ncbi:thioesterase superfamily protein [Colletotrichum higginsianum]|uniref:Thioesterase superfamily protein n=2 Tax=Colletotrichum higginsianum TaxID=80884 RepID=H1V934_COLHI|nr:Thioesterase superfamily protein [Colletotrichum higginsianum IMI 349063]OBR09009.1 Thioesterase superfamily protein [Colletotrichum higginsianum IMI 349063]TIC96132.1 Acyl-coenzyme A thioesterase THEM4 [Colletotrichum higginsianum]CCF36737.1 thioesterase superfamily protein [Colletotrichum higginsianum]
MKSANPDMQHFLGIPWCAALLSESGIVRDTAPSRFPKPSTEDQLFSTTLHTEETIAAYLAFYKRPSSPASSSFSSSSSSSSSSSATIPGSSGGGNLIRELRALLTLRSGVNGYPNVSHGGIVATVLDETIGMIFLINKAEGLIPEEAYMTAYLNVTYVRPVATPQTVLCVVEVVSVKGRKWLIEGRIEDEEGRVLAKAESLFVRLKEKL